MRHAWRSGNHFTLLPDAKHYLPAIVSAIETANESVLFEQYLFASGRLADRINEALIQAADRGVHVQVLLDRYGAKGLKHHDRARLMRAGVSLRLFNPLFMGRLSTNLTRDHRKLVLVDRRVAFTGGFCITDDFLEHWFDLAVRSEGPVVSVWQGLFAQLWASSLTQGDDERLLPQGMLSDRNVEPREQGMMGRVVWQRGHRYQAVRLSLQARIAKAARRAWVYTPYFVPTPSLCRHLMAAAQRGVDVRLLVAGRHHDHPSVHYAGRHYYGRLLRAGVRIYEYQPSFTHAKFCLVDDWCTIGSCNFDHWSLRWNLEANLEVEDTRFVTELATLYSEHIATSNAISSQEWSRRPWWQWGREHTLGKVNAWLTLLR
ncbi:phospholipase D-like domain-containing protein [Halomonas korlensis]|uniref:Phosphatidylserine/phosphatidylglycerophosphate/cardiolipin synthase n=1 Tax=Halomonas korlensis TaxID=463301 RepID=A0A1I7HXX0_9GAMM|nr:phospholipase D-like domain-containing protein [Halomonas korlensis]SFU65499.1 Phosphatidylserine/phosphatidylglycerophosphate/cardiolipin synthase [Halomonas korlensis]